MIGTHSVFLNPDPDGSDWGPVLNANSGFNANVTGWVPWPGANPWTWAAPGKAVAPPAGPGTGLPGLWAGPTLVLPRDPAATAYRVRIGVTTDRACQVLASVRYGPTAAIAGDPSASGGKNVGTYTTIPGAQTITVSAISPTADIPASLGFVGLYGLYIWQTGVGVPQISFDYMELYSEVAETFDISCLVDSISIHYGRDDTDEQPEAATATLDLSLDSADTDLPTGLEIGAELRVVTDTAATTSTRFVGRVTDINLGWEDEGENTPNALVVQVLAASRLADLGRRVVGDVPWAQELDGARVARIMANAGITLDPTYSDPGTVQILARDVDAQAALPLAQEAAKSAVGVVWETRDGQVRYADADHRRGAVAALSLDACDILVTPTWRRTTEGLINRVALAYGVAPAGGEQPQWITDAPSSIAAYGRYEYSASTVLAALADAQAMASLLLVRNSSPVWILSELPVDVAGLDEADTVALLSLEMHALLDLTGLPGAGNLPTSYAVWVEGWTETLAYGLHEMTLTVSGYCRTAPPPRWDDVDPAQTWDGSVRTWDAWACVGPTPNRGRWADVPASTRWDTVDPAITWNTYT